jgi:hypothetical protein
MLDPYSGEPTSKGLETVDRVTRFASESLARTVNRRGFIQRAGTSLFFALAGLAAGQALTSGRSASAQTGDGGINDPARPAPVPGVGPSAPSCAPPGPNCNLTGVNTPDGCIGGNCYQHLNSGTVLECSLYYQFYAAGCWTTSVTGGYWTCCDCECFNSSGTRVATCGCAQFSGTPFHGTG